jgi:hypothetical protein
MPIDPAIRDHQAWLGYLQPDGLVVSPAALVDAQVLLNRNDIPLQQRFFTATAEIKVNDEDDPVRAIPNFATLAQEFLEWPEDCLFGLTTQRPLPDALTVELKELGETLSPTFAFKDPKAKNESEPWLLLGKTLLPGTSLDEATTGDQASWTASASRRFERLLRETRVAIGILSNGTHIRLMYAPRGENSGTLTFPVAAMTEVAGRPILAAFEMLLSRYRLLAAPSEARLPTLLARSRDYQSRVSTTLAAQVLEGLYELLRGIQAADERTEHALLRDVLAHKPDEVYAGLLTVLMRLVFLLFAEDRGLMPSTSVYQQNYAVHGLFERLRSDQERYPDTMDQRYGAWAQLVALFRAIYDGCPHAQMKMPARRGHLFDPERYKFLEGRTLAEQRLPLISDGVIYRVLRNLLVLDGQRLSYRTLDVEQIGSVYEVMMGFSLGITKGPTIAIKPKKPLGAAMPINLAELLAVSGSERAKWLKENTDQELSGEAVSSLKTAKTIPELLAALERRIARNVTPTVIAPGGLVPIPSDERRRSGSNYTPRSLTEPIVRKTLEPILKRLGENPTPQRILELKICDIAVGSGAFLVEACRQLAEHLVKAWHSHQDVPQIPADEDELLYAKRLIAQRCLYGVDRNPMAADLAKLSLWLATLAKDHPFTFLDHAIRQGDSLVGLTQRQIRGFHWKPSSQTDFNTQIVDDRVSNVRARRQEILEAGDFLPFETKRAKLDKADEELGLVRFIGDLAVAAFFSAEKDKARQEKRNEYLHQLAEYFRMGNPTLRPGRYVDDLRSGQLPITPFHWEIEFPEVFARENGGFDAIVGNPPFAGKNTLINGNRDHYLPWLQTAHEESHGNADLVAHFFRRAFSLLRANGTFGLIATNTIGQGDTRSTGLRWICTHGGDIYSARKRYKWPGAAAVIVSIVEIIKGTYDGPHELDGRRVESISAYLFHFGGHESPHSLSSNKGRGFKGVEIGSLGFLLIPGDDEFTRFSKYSDPRDARLKIVKPYIGGEDLNAIEDGGARRYVIDFDGLTPSQVERYPEILAHLRTTVYPDFLARGEIDARTVEWWHFRRPSTELRRVLGTRPRLLVLSRVSDTGAFTFVRDNPIANSDLICFDFDSFAAFCSLQARPHDVWVRREASSMKDDPRYTPSDCFETFPFPANFDTHALLESAGREYYQFRCELMAQSNEGLTKTYNRFHDPSEVSADIARLRELHSEMDRAVLDAYGWTEIPTTCGFALDYLDIDDEEARNIDIPDTLFFPTAAEALAFAARLPATRRRLPWRHRWPDAVRDEVLARLLAENAKRAKEEQLAGAAATAKPKKATKKPKAKKGSGQALFETE